MQKGKKNLWSVVQPPCILSAQLYCYAWGITINHPEMMHHHLCLHLLKHADPHVGQKQLRKSNPAYITQPDTAATQTKTIMLCINSCVTIKLLTNKYQWQTWCRFNTSCWTCKQVQRIAWIVFWFLHCSILHPWLISNSSCRRWVCHWTKSLLLLLTSHCSEQVAFSLQHIIDNM